MPPWKRALAIRSDGLNRINHLGRYAIPRSLTAQSGKAWLHALEIRNALRLKRHRKELTESQLRGALRSLQDDIDSGFLGAEDQDLHELFVQAESLSAEHTVSTGVRSLDVLHVAAALILMTDEFVSFDRRQRSLAAKAGLKVLPRLVPKP